MQEGMEGEEAQEVDNWSKAVLPTQYRDAAHMNSQWLWLHAQRPAQNQASQNSTTEGRGDTQSQA